MLSFRELFIFLDDTLMCVLNRSSWCSTPTRACLEPSCSTPARSVIRRPQETPLPLCGPCCTRTIPSSTTHSTTHWPQRWGVSPCVNFLISFFPPMKWVVTLRWISWFLSCSKVRIFPSVNFFSCCEVSGFLLMNFLISFLLWSEKLPFLEFPDFFAALK